MLSRLLLALGSELAMTSPANSGAKRLILQSKLEHEELQEQFDRAWRDVFGKDSCKNGSIHEFSFLSHH